MNMNTNISFRGLNDNYFAVAAGSSPNDVVKMSAFRFCTTLSDDEKGKDLDAFYTAMNKSNLDGDKFIGKYFPDDVVTLDMSKVRIGKGENELNPIRTFILNGQALRLDNDGVLPMFSFLAKTIKKAGEQAENPQEKKVAELMNKNIENAVIDYLG